MRAESAVWTTTVRRNITFLVALVACSWATAQPRVSEPGRYEGYSQARFDGWTRTSQYVAVRDGTRIAIDIFRPTHHGALHDAPLPVVWEHRRYQRASIGPDGRITSQLDRGDHPMRTVVAHGYVYAVADVRGSGASFGTRVDATPPQESLDAYDITEWLAAQPWSSGRVGMYGISYAGTAQLMAARTAPPHLKAVFPEMVMFDLYDFCCPGGIFRETFLRNWADITRRLDRHQSQKAAPVDEDQGQILLKLAAWQHRGNFDLSRVFEAPYRDSSFGDLDCIYARNTPSAYIRDVRASRVAVYLRAGWLDMFPRDMLLWFGSLDDPKKITIGPWNHYESHGLDRGTEMLRWFDYWLKDIDNGIMDEPPIYYCVMDAPEDTARRWAHRWPIAEAQPTRYYFCAGPSGSIESVNDGLLATAPGADGCDSYFVDCTTTTGSATRWTGGTGPAYPDMAANDRKALTYTTEPLTVALELVGHPVLHVWIQCSADDVDLFAYLEHVDAHGRSTYVTEGCLRASHRRLSPAPYDNFGLPYHRSYEQDVAKLGGEPVEVVFDLLPTARHFAAGHRLRLTLACADKGNYRPLVSQPAPAIKVLRDTQHLSCIVLPVVR